MKDTAKRIRAYKAALPGLKERLAAVALLLVVSTVMMISATFAWITLSRAPGGHGHQYDHLRQRQSGDRIVG